MLQRKFLTFSIPDSIKNIDIHFKNNWNKIIDNFKISKHKIKQNKISNNQKYDFDLYAFQINRKAKTINGFIRKLNFINKIKYILSLKLNV